MSASGWSPSAAVCGSSPARHSILSGLAWIAAVPMLLAVDRAPTYSRALFLGWWAGVVETAGGFYWLIDVMQRFADFPWIAAALVFFLFCAARALIFLLFTAIVCAIRAAPQGAHDLARAARHGGVRTRRCRRYFPAASGSRRPGIRWSSKSPSSPARWASPRS